MYTRHFDLTAEPFSLTPDPKFLYLSATHAEALAALKIGLLGRRGLMVMTGEVGTGKTTLLYSLLGALGDGMRTAYVSNTSMGFDAILRLALADFEVTPASHGRVDMLTALNQFLRDCAEHGDTATLVIDEAQNLDAEAFEQLRLLTNFETFTHKLLQIVLVGQPELETHLRQPALRALTERVAVHCRLTPLGERERRAYLDYRLLRAGGSTRLFDREARELILAASEGLPRRINILSHNALLFAYGRGHARVTRPVAQLSIGGRAALLLGDPPAEPSRATATVVPRRVARTALAVSIVGLLAALGVAGLSTPIRLFGPGNTDAKEPAPAPAPAAASSPPGPPPRSIASLPDSPLPPGEGQGEGTQQPALVDSSADPIDERQAPAPAGEAFVATSLPPRSDAESAAAEPPPSSIASLPGSPLPPGEGQGEGTRQPAFAEPSADPVTEHQNPGDRADNAPLPAADPAPVVAGDPRAPANASAPADDPAAQQDTRPRFRTVRVTPGSTLESLALEVYGSVDATLIKRVQAANPQVVDPNVILAGDLLRFPEVAPGRPDAQ